MQISRDERARSGSWLAYEHINRMEKVMEKSGPQMPWLSARPDAGVFICKRDKRQVLYGQKGEQKRRKEKANINYGTAGDRSARRHRYVRTL